MLVFTIFGSVVWFYIITITLLIGLFIAESEEIGWVGFIIFLGYIILDYYSDKNYNLGMIFTWQNVLIYLSLGVVFSLIRTYFKGKELSEDEKKRFELKEHVFRWIFMFPISLLNWLVFKVLFKDIFNYLYKKAESTYIKLFNM